MIRYFTVPYDSGHRAARMGAGPLRLVEELGVQAHAIETEMKLPREITTSFELYAKLAKAVQECVAAGDFPVVFSGNCGAINGLAAGFGVERLAVIWFDAHGEYMTPDTTVSGFLDGMGLSILTGRCFRRLAASIPGFTPIPPTRTALIGSRDYSPGEREDLVANGVALLGPADVDRWFSSLEADRLLVHIDLDVLDPAHGRANEFAADGGLSPEQILHVIAIARTRFDIVALELASYDPAVDEGGRVAKIGAEIVRAAARG